MQGIQVGETGVVLSKVCFGTLQLGRLLSSLPSARAAEVLVYAWECGITTFDTASSFHSRHLLFQAFGTNPGIVLVDKSLARTYEEMEQQIAESLVELDRDELDVFLLYDVRSHLDFEARKGAWTYLREAKEMGLLRAIGLSTCTVEGALLAAELPEVDLVQVVFNLTGAGILDGDRASMEAALERLKAAGKTTCAIKPLAGGMLDRDHLQEALSFALTHPLVDCVCVGMSTHQEVDVVCAIAKGEPLSEEQQANIAQMRRRLVILNWCTGCEACIPVCPTQALYLRDGFARVYQERCDWCGKCGPVCPEHAIFLVPAISSEEVEDHIG